MLRTAGKLNRLVFAGFLLGFAFAGSAHGMQPCPSRATLLKDAKTIVEVRVKSLFIGDTQPPLVENFPARTMRVELEVKRVIKGDFIPKEVVAFSYVFPPGPVRELTLMALLYGFHDGPGDTFEWEPLLHQTETGEKIYVVGACEYYRFPDFVEELNGTEGGFRKFDRLPPP